MGPTIPEKADLRDKIAMAVIKGMQINALGIRSIQDNKSDEFIALLADTAYRISDAMILRRANPIKPAKPLATIVKEFKAAMDNIVKEA